MCSEGWDSCIRNYVEGVRVGVGISAVDKSPRKLAECLQVPIQAATILERTVGTTPCLMMCSR